jgi:hypothetical protein
MKMDRGFLENYDAKEINEMNEIIQKLHDGKIVRERRYPPSNRLKLNEPYTLSIKGQSLWTQILPNIGTVVIELKPIKQKNMFEAAHGFKIGDIERLIEFAKETGKIQFCLSGLPHLFEEIDFLEPIFLEFLPPVMVHLTPALAFFPIDFENGLLHIDYSHPADEIKIWADEILYFSEHLRFNEDCIDILEKIYGRFPCYPRMVYIQLLLYDYISLRILGYHELADEINLNLSINPVKALFLLSVTKDLILSTNLDLLGGIKSMDRNIFKSELNLLKPFLSTEICEIPQSVNFPIEIGKFLNDKLKLIIPENYRGVLEVNDLYDEKDLKKLTRSLQKAIETEDLSGINKNADEIFTILNNTWNDAEQLKKHAIFFRHGISFGIAALGAVATLPIGGVGGLLAGLGFEVAEKIADIRAYELVSEKIMKWATPSHMIHVYDFKKKYKLIGE